MHRLLGFAVAVSTIAVWFSSAASAQDCERFAWQCQGYSGPRGQPTPSMFGMPSPNGRATFGQPNPAVYATLSDEPFPVSAVSLTQIDPAFLRQTVSYFTGEAAGTIVIDTDNHFLYFVQENGQAIRYGVGVGREGFGWSALPPSTRNANGPTGIRPKKCWSVSPS